MTGNHIDRGVITLVTGCMFSGKTTELLLRLDHVDPHRTLAVKHVTDMRFVDGLILTHGGKSRPAVTVNRSWDIVEFAGDNVELVGIDEAHFFDADLPSVVSALANAGKSVVITSLDPDSWGQPFVINIALEKICGEVIRKSATCARCRAPANRTQRLTPIIDGRMIVDPSNYEPRCLKCWHAPPESPL